MGLLQEHLNKIIRFQEEDLIVYEPKAHHLLEIRSILEESIKFNEELRAEGDISTKSLKYLMKILTNIFLGFLAVFASSSSSSSVFFTKQSDIK